MGLLSEESGPPDTEAAFAVAQHVQTWWNTRQAPVYGFNLKIWRGSVTKACEVGNNLFSGKYFSRTPGPFKRVAAFTVIGRLYPFFSLVPLAGMEADTIANVLPKTPREQHAWLARMMALAIPAVLRCTRVYIDGEWRVLDEWRGFPTLHYKLEFLAWLRWLDAFEQYRDHFASSAEWSAFSEKRLARMVMATSLMVESCYYQEPIVGSPQIRGNTARCFDQLEEEHALDTIYDVHTQVIPPEFPPERE
jgi:hypothetical protein